MEYVKKRLKNGHNYPQQSREHGRRAGHILKVQDNRLRNQVFL